MIAFAPTAILLPLTFRWQNKQSKISGHSGLMISLRTGNVLIFGSCVLIFKMNRQRWEWAVAGTWWHSHFHPVREENKLFIAAFLAVFLWLGMKICWEIKNIFVLSLVTAKRQSEVKSQELCILCTPIYPPRFILYNSYSAYILSSNWMDG